MKNKFLIFPAAAVSVLIVGVGAVAAYSFYENYSYLQRSNTQMSAELSSVRVERYVATMDINAGDVIVYEGDGQNVELVQAYSSMPDGYYLDGEQGYAQTDIPEGSPVLKSQVAEAEPLSVLEPEQVVEEVPESFDLPYLLTAKHVDRNGTELHSDTQINLGDGVGEQSLHLFAEEIDGYYLYAVRINGSRVFSIGAVRAEDVDGNKMYYYYTSEDAMTRHEITSDMEVVFTYRQGEAPAYATTSRFIGIAETGTETGAEETAPDGSSVSGNSAEDGAILYDDINSAGEEDSGNGTGEVTQ